MTFVRFNWNYRSGKGREQRLTGNVSRNRSFKPGHDYNPQKRLVPAAVEAEWRRKLADSGFMDIESHYGEHERFHPDTERQGVDVELGWATRRRAVAALEDEAVWAPMRDGRKARVFWALVAQFGWPPKPAGRLLGWTWRRVTRTVSDVQRRIA